MENEQVGRLDAAMGQPGLIDVLKTLRDLSDKVAGLLDRERPDLADESLEIHSFHVLHREELKPGLLLYLVGLDDVGMRKSNDRFRFAVELPDKSRLITHFLPEHFQGNMPPAHGLPGFENLAHPPSPSLSRTW